MAPAPVKGGGGVVSALCDIAGGVRVTVPELWVLAHRLRNGEKWSPGVSAEFTDARTWSLNQHV